MNYTLVAMVLVENNMPTTSLWRSEHLILNKDLSAGSDLRWWPSELTNERAPAGADLVHHTTQSKCATNTSHHAILTSCYPVLLKLLGSLIVLVQFLSNGKALSTRLHGTVGWLGGKMETEIDRHSFGRLHLSSLPWIFISFDPSFKISIFIISSSSL